MSIKIVDSETGETIAIMTRSGWADPFGGVFVDSELLDFDTVVAGEANHAIINGSCVYCYAEGEDE